LEGICCGGGTEIGEVDIEALSMLEYIAGPAPIGVEGVSETDLLGSAAPIEYGGEVELAQEAMDVVIIDRYLLGEGRVDLLTPVSIEVDETSPAVVGTDQFHLPIFGIACEEGGEPLEPLTLDGLLLGGEAFHEDSVDNGDNEYDDQ